MNEIGICPRLSEAAQIHLARFLAPICKGRTVKVAGNLSTEVIAALGATIVEQAAVPGLPAEANSSDVLLCLDPGAARQTETIRHLAKSIGARGVFAVLYPPEDVPQTHFPYIAHFRLRSVNGSLLTDEAFIDARMAALRDPHPAAASTLRILLGSNAPLPPLAGGLFEGVSATDCALATRPLMRAGRRSRTETSHHALRDALAAAEARVVLLGERLMEVDERTFGLRRHISRLSAAQGYNPSEGKPFFDVPKTPHAWPLVKDGTLEPLELDLYDRRVDDPVVLEGRRGAAFLDAFSLGTAAPDLAGCIAALNGLTPQSGVPMGRSPDVSIVIPVYGQLGYTLNCIDSLLRHRSRYSAEIIVIDDHSRDGVTDVFLPQLDSIRYQRQPVNGGFIKSCNTGAAIACGAFVLMLNNDTRVVEGWLDALVESFTLFPSAGLVGSKMLYPDGSLQEAGGILWRDGSAWNYGRGDDPNRPQYCHAREVDYISGCSILLPTDLWRELGGFDVHFNPAYAEDADLAMRVVAAGRQVWFQPQSRVVHYEGKTGGTDTGAGTKAYQISNLKKLFLRWREAFEAHRPNGEAPYLERERKIRRRFLVVDAVAPTPNQDAGSVQTVLALKCCRELGYKTYFVAEDNWLFVPDYIPDLQRQGIECTYAPYETKFEGYIRLYGWMFDVVMVYRVGILDRTIGLLRQYAPQAVVIYHVADLHFLRLARQAELDNDKVVQAAALALKARELKLVASVDCTVTHSTVEAEILAQELPNANVTVWPLMFDHFGTAAGFNARRDICFLGGYRHQPNVDAVRYFLREIFPLLKAELPEISFIVAGANPPGEIIALQRHDVIVTGMVEDLCNVFDVSRVFVCPLRVGAGAKGKVMSALSHGLPVVSTSIGVEGAGLTDGVHVLVADTPEAIAQSILCLYRDEELWQRFSENGQALIKDRFSVKMGQRKLQEAIDKAYRHKVGLV